MSVPLGFLALLTDGPAYGSQLQREFTTRAPHREQLNAGQVYATLERLVKRGCAVRDGTTDDGLPLYRITEPGRREAEGWLTDPSGSADEWAEMQDQVLICASLSPADGVALIRRYRDALGTEPGGGPVRSAAACATDAATRLRTSAALEWLDALEQALTADPDRFKRPRDATRPRRGRRSAQTA